MTETPISLTEDDVNSIASLVVLIPRAEYEKNQQIVGDNTEWTNTSTMRAAIWRYLGLTEPPYPQINIHPADVRSISLQVNTTASQEVRRAIEEVLEPALNLTFTRPNI